MGYSPSAADRRQIRQTQRLADNTEGATDEDVKDVVEDLHERTKNLTPDNITTRSNSPTTSSSSSSGSSSSTSSSGSSSQKKKQQNQRPKGGGYSPDAATRERAKKMQRLADATEGATQEDVQQVYDDYQDRTTVELEQVSPAGAALSEGREEFSKFMDRQRMLWSQNGEQEAQMTPNLEFFEESLATIQSNYQQRLRQMMTRLRGQSGGGGISAGMVAIGAAVLVGLFALVSAVDDGVGE